jgi:type I restriction enzyme S subunit
MKTNQSQTNIPKGWKFHKLDDLLTFIVDNRGKTPPIQSSGIPMAEVNAIGDKNIKYSEITKFVSEETYKTWFRKHLEKNDILFSTVGRTASCSIYTGSTKTVIAQNLIGLRFGKDNPEFMFYLLTQDKNNQEFKNIEMSAAQPSVKVSQMIHLEFLVPPLAEQNRIVSILETWDKSIVKLTQKIQAKKQIKKGLMQDLLTGKKRLAGFKDKWVNIKVGEVFSFLRTYAVSRENLVNDTSNNQGIGNIHYGDIHSTYGSSSIDLRKISVPQIKDIDFKFDKNDLLINGDLIMADVSEDYAGIGTTISIHELANKKILGGLHTFVLRDKSKMTVENYRQYLFQNEDIRNRLRKIANGVSVYGISKGNLSKMKLDLPSVREQTIIADILTTADKEITELEKKLSILKEQKRYLLNNLITGTIRTPETLSTKLTK